MQLMSRFAVCSVYSTLTSKRMAHMNIYEVFSKSSLDSSHSDMCMTNTEMIILPGCAKLSEAHRQINNSNKNSNKDTNNSNSLNNIWGGLSFTCKTYKLSIRQKKSS